MLKLIFLFINILSLTLQIDHCIRTYEICTKCDTGYYIVQNEYQYICSHIPNCLTIDYDGKYYVLFHGEWVEFSESYVKYIEEQVDNIAF